MQLDRVPPPHLLPDALRGTPAPPDGVSATDLHGEGVAACVRRASPRSWLLLVLALVSLLGQGERFEVDRRFRSPSATLVTYWDALRRGDAETAWRCLTEVRRDAPFPGMLWFLPETESFRLDEFRSLPVTAGRVMVTYQVRFRPVGESLEQGFPSGNELVRVRGEWRIARSIGEVSLPEWRPTPRAVDM